MTNPCRHLETHDFLKRGNSSVDSSSFLSGIILSVVIMWNNLTCTPVSRFLSLILVFSKRSQCSLKMSWLQFRTGNRKMCLLSKSKDAYRNAFKIDKRSQPAQGRASENGQTENNNYISLEQPRMKGILSTK